MASQFEIFTSGENPPDPSGVKKLAALRRQAPARKQFDEAPLYRMDSRLATVINVALVTGHPLLLTGDPGAGKTMAAFAIAFHLDLGEPLVFHVQSDSRAKDLRYTFKAIDYFRAVQLAEKGDPKPQPSDPRFLEEGKLWQAIKPKDAKPKVLLIDEIDKAPRDFPNDLLHELDRLEFEVPEHEQPGFKVEIDDIQLRPVIVITSNAERRLPEPFLRRCVYHHLQLADLNDVLELAIKAHLGPIADSYDAEAITAGANLLKRFAGQPDIRKKPSMAELCTWMLAVHASDPASRLEAIAKLKEERIGALPYLGTLLKTWDDIAAAKRGEKP